jgi:predicted Zn-dependent peptidase
MPFYHQTLANGLTVLGETSASARSSAVGFFVRTGSRDETGDVSGVTHFLEHMVFKGTPRRTALEVNRDFDRIGADYNAFTSEENTVFHACVLPEYLPDVVDLLADILRPSLRGEDFDMEKKVIIEEIHMYEDRPTWCAYDRVKQAYFDGHNLGNSILGTPESITALTRDQMHAYFSRRYVAPNITVVCAGRFDWEAFLDVVAKHCGGWETGPVGREGVVETAGSGRFEVVPKERFVQENVILMSGGPPADSSLRHAANLLGMVIGDDSNSRLYWELVDPGHADSAGCGFDDYEGTGAYYTSFSCEPEQAQENLERAMGVLGKVQRGGITEEELSQAKSKLLSRVVRGGERPKGRLMSVGMDWTYLGQYRTVDDELRSYEGVTLADVGRLLERYPLTRVTGLALGPVEKLAMPAGNGAG